MTLAEPTAAPDPAGWHALLADGGIVWVRPVAPSDLAALRALHDAASDRSIYLRYFSLNRLAGERYVDHLLAADGGPERPLGRRTRSPGGTYPMRPERLLDRATPTGEAAAYSAQPPGWVPRRSSVARMAACVRRRMPSLASRWET